MAKQPAKLHPLEMALLGAREIAEELGEVVIVYFIDMAIAEGNCSRPTFGCHAGMGSGLPSRVRRIASMARMQRRRAVSMTDRRSA